MHTEGKNYVIVLINIFSIYRILKRNYFFRYYLFFLHLLSRLRPMRIDIILFFCQETPIVRLVVKFNVLTLAAIFSSQHKWSYQDIIQHNISDINQSKSGIKMEHPEYSLSRFNLPYAPWHKAS